MATNVAERGVRDIVSDGEIISQLGEMSVAIPRAADLRRAVIKRRLSARDAVYFLLLEAMEKRRSHPQVSQAVPSRGA